MSSPPTYRHETTYLRRRRYRKRPSPDPDDPIEPPSMFHLPAPGRPFRRHRDFDWDHEYVYHTDSALPPSFDDSSPPMSPGPVSANDLPSRISALNRRAAVVSGNLTHLNAVVKPLESTKVHELSDWHIKDLCDEYQCLAEAMTDFVEQMREVYDMMQEVYATRRKAVGGWEKVRDREWSRGKGLPF